MYVDFMKKVTELNLPIIFFGAGRAGEELLEKFKKEHVDIECFCDNDLNKIGKELNGKKIYSIEAVREKFNDFLVLISIKDPVYIEEVICSLKEKNIMESRIIQFDIYSSNDMRELCAEAHKTTRYFKQAESEELLNIFWGDSSLAYRLFKNLDLENVIELACGEGRHVPKYLNAAGSVTLVDILGKNIDYCKKRFKDSSNINYYQNSGKDLIELESNQYTSLFTYDAMVHFESIDVYYYLQETHRVLRKGGRALFHHSNNTADYKQSFLNSVSGMRSYMSAQLFAHFAHRAGFTIVEQQVIDWGGAKDLDCITLVEK